MGVVGRLCLKKEKCYKKKREAKKRIAAYLLISNLATTPFEKFC